jgi:hypothetical protein
MTTPERGFAGTLLRRIFPALLLFAPALPLLAAFGQNQVNVHNFRWKVAKTAHFDIHYTPESESLVPGVTRFAERAYARLTRSLDVVPSERVSLFIFNNHNRFEENNIAPVGEGTGGVTEAFKNRIILFNDGTWFWLDHVVTHEFTHVLQFEVLYGGFWKSARLLKSPLYPLWVMEGLAEYGIGDIDQAEEDLYLRDAALDGKLYSLFELHGFNHLKPHQVTLGYKSGASIMRFLAEEYGPDVPAALLKGMRDRFEAASVASDLTRQDFRALDARWREHITDRYKAQVARLKLREPDAYGTRLTAEDFLPAFNLSPVFSPDGRYLAFLTDREGPQQVEVTDLKTGASKLLAGRQWDLVENIHHEGRPLSFSPDGRWLAFAGEKEQRDFLYHYDLKRGRLRRVRTPFEELRSPVFHPTENKLVISGMRGGTNDLYEITPRGKVLRRLTDTPFDEADPVYSPDGKTLVFSREEVGREKYERNLAALDLDTLAVRPLTDMPGDEIAPCFTPDGKSVVFVSDALEGVRNLYRLDLKEGRVLLLTRALGGNFSPWISRDGSRAAFTSFRHNSQSVYLAGPDLWNPAPEKAETVFAGQPSRLPAPARTAEAPAAPLPPPPAFLTEGVPGGISEIVPYRFRASTDLFFPVLYYSSQDGLFFAALWQASEHLGNHEVQGTLQYGSGQDFLDYQITYRYKRFRPQFVAMTGGQTFYQDFAKIDQRKEKDEALGVVYPLDRFQRIETFAAEARREDILRGGIDQDVFYQEDNVSVSFIRDTTTGRYLTVNDGGRFRLTRTAARPVSGGTLDYDSTETELHRFQPTGGESALAFRGLLGLSTGPSNKYFRMGGVDRIRGYPRNDASEQATRYVLGNLEWRVPLKYLNGGGVFFLPEIAFKALYGTLFVDGGYDATPGDRMVLGGRRPKASVGAGLRIPSFILQTYPVTLSLDVAKRVDTDQWTWYFALGPQF